VLQRDKATYSRLEGRPRLALVFLPEGFALVLCSFISECGFGGIRNRAPIKRRASPMSSELDFFEVIGLKPDDPKLKEIVAYCAALGAFMHVWGFWEYMFDLCIAIIHARSSDGTIVDKKRPVISLERKVRYFRKAHASIERLKPYQAAGESIANSIEKMGAFRHMVIHSAQDYTNSPLVQFTKMLPDDELMPLPPGKIREMRIKLTHHQILEGAKIIGTMLTPMGEYMRLLLKTFPKEHR
jgi:hypothetical protein